MLPTQIMTLMLNTVMQNAETMLPICNSKDPAMFIRPLETISTKTIARVAQGTDRNVLYLELLTSSSSYVVNFKTFDQVPIRTGEVKICMNHCEINLQYIPADLYVLEIIDSTGGSQLFEIIKLP